MAQEDAVAERLRAFVRERVRKDGAHYKWGNNARLAKHLKLDPGWVTAYADPSPTSPRHANLDTALAICEFYSVDLKQFIRADSAMDPPDTPPRDFTRSVKLLGMMSEKGLREAAGLLAGLARAYPHAAAPESVEQHARKTAETTRKVRGKR